MEIKVQIPFRQLLNAVKMLTPFEKAKLREELAEEKPLKEEKAEFINMLLNGPIYTEEEIKIIEDNRKSIAR